MHIPHISVSTTCSRIPNPTKCPFHGRSVIIFSSGILMRCSYVISEKYSSSSYCFRRFRLFNQGLSRSIFLSDSVKIFFRQVHLSLKIWSNLSASILVTRSSHSLLLLLISTHLLIGCIPQDSLICWFLILFLFSQLFFLVLSTHFRLTFDWFLFLFLFLLNMS